MIERLNEEFRRRVKTQGALPTEDSALILLFELVATGQITLRKLDGYKQLAAVIRQRMRPAASKNSPSRLEAEGRRGSRIASDDASHIWVDPKSKRFECGVYRVHGSHVGWCSWKYD